MLRSGLETLGPEFDVVDLPSGEEALLEVTRRPVDLLIADVRLAGMTGLELQKKFRARNPQSKVILITGVTDPLIRQQVAGAGADAFFIKPIPMPEFLDAVNRCLGNLEPVASKTSSEPVRLLSSQAVSQRISDLKRELKAISVIILDLQGRIQAASGDLPDGAIESKMTATLLAALHTSAQVSEHLHSGPSGNLLCFEGRKYDLALTHIGDDHVLLVATNKGAGSEYLGTLGFSLHMASQDILALLEDSPRPDQVSAPPTDSSQEVANQEENDSEADPELEALFHATQADQLDPEEVDDFWDNLLAGQESNAIPNPDVISFEQAKKLGLEPDEDDD
jgi:CheY-like chemotaxis protein/predicted regulator of Ras-like GTPase activity (Roadblock/LC7/MglB family)